MAKIPQIDKIVERRVKTMAIMPTLFMGGYFLSAYFMPGHKPNGGKKILKA